jgi:RecA/RadA recombinase
MAKKKTAVVAEKMSLDDVMDAAATQMRAEMGESKVLVGGKADAKHVGLYIPHLILRFLFQSTILPLGGRMMQITGKQMSCKSSFLYWLYKLFRSYSGKAHHIEVETKDSEPLRNSILEYDERAVQPYSADSIEDWQEILLYLLDDKKGVRGALAQAGLLDLYPVIQGVDSFTAKASREIQEKIVEAGHAGRDHPIEAMSISKFLKTMPAHFKDIPWFMAGTNHLKPSQDFMGRPVDNVGGGMSLKFQETFEVKMQRIKKMQTASYEGVRLSLLTAKNSIGPFDKEIETDMLWYTDRETGRQRTWWDWDSASVQLILGKNCPRDALSQQKTRLRELRDITGIQDVSGGKAFSKVLDIPQGDAQDLSVVARELEKRADVLKEVHLILGIQEHMVFQPGTSFKAAVKAARESTGQAAEEGSYVEKTMAEEGVAP